MTKIETSNFKRLIGTWQTEGTILNEKGNLKLTGIDTYEFILDGNYLLHKANVIMGTEKSETYEIIEFDNSIEKTKMHYYNSKGESGNMTGYLIENQFKIEGNQIKFEGVLDDYNSKLVGKWFLLSDLNEWVGFIDLKLTKQK